MADSPEARLPKPCLRCPVSECPVVVGGMSGRTAAMSLPEGWLRDGFAYGCYSVVVTARNRVSRVGVFAAAVVAVSAAVQFWG